MQVVVHKIGLFPQLKNTPFASKQAIKEKGCSFNFLLDMLVVYGRKHFQWGDHSQPHSNEILAVLITPCPMHPELKGGGGVT